MREMLYKAYDPQGTLVEGTTQVEDEQEAMNSFQKRGLYLVQLTPVNATEGGLWQKLDRYFNRVQIEDLIIFTRQFHTLFKAGLGVDVLLETLAKQAQNKLLREALSKIREDIQSGLSLAAAFAKHPHVFDKLYTSMLLAGEEAGILEQVLGELASVLEKENRLRHEVAAATLYPKIVIGVMGMALYVMLTFVIPKFADFYGKYQAALPLPTRILMALGNFASQYWYVVLLGIGTLVFLTVRYLKSPQGRLRWDGLKLKIPVFGPLFQKIAMARFGHLFSALYRSGLHLVRSFEILSCVIGNEAYAVEILGFREGILKGRTIAEVMRESKNFSAIMVETTAVGEQSGNLDHMLTSMAGHFDLEVSHIAKNLVTLLEPILLIVLFGMVTLMALGIFLPMWNLSKVVMK